MTTTRNRKATRLVTEELSRDARTMDTAERKPDSLDLVVAYLERVMPDMSVLGAVLLMFILYLAVTGSDFGINEDTLNALQQAREATANELGYVPL